MALRRYSVKRPTYFRKRRAWKRLIALFVLVPSLGIGLFYAVFFSGALAVSEIELRGAEKTSRDALRQIIAEFLERRIAGAIPQNNIILIPSAELASTVRERLPALRSVQASKNILKRRLLVAVEERTYAGIWCTRGERETTHSASSTITVTVTSTAADSAGRQLPSHGPCFLMDAKGVLYDMAPESTGILQLRLVGSTPQDPQLGATAVNGQTLAWIARAKEALEKQFSIRTTVFELRDPADAIAHTSAGWPILFDTARPLESALSALRQALAAIDQSVRTIEYLDLRIEGRVYYKTKSKP